MQLDGSNRTCGGIKSLKPAPFIAALLFAFPVFSQQISPSPEFPGVVGTVPAGGVLPDLGAQSSASQTNVQPGPGSLILRRRAADSRFTATTESSRQSGMSLGVRGALFLFEGAALGGGLMAGRDKTEFFANIGSNLSASQRVVVTAAQTRQKLEFDFVSGRAKADMTQNAVGAAWRIQLGGTLLDHAELNAYSARTASRDLGAASYAVDNGALYELWSDPRRVAGGKMDGVQGSLGLRPWQGGGLKIGFGQERLSYDLAKGNENYARGTGSLGLEQAVNSQTRIRAGVDNAAAQNRYSLGLDYRFGNAGTLSIEAVSIKGRDGVPGDCRMQLSWSFPLGRLTGGNGATSLAGLRAAPAGMNAIPAAHTTLAGSNAPTRGAVFSDEGLLDQVAARPGWLPSQVVAKRDATAAATRLIAIDRTALPAGATIGAGGIVSAPLGIVAAGIAGVTKNGAAFANAGQFSLSGSNIVVNPNLIAQPAVGVVDVYVITVNIAGGGTSLVTVNVSHGSVRIDSIVIRGPPTASAVSITGTVQVGQTLTGHYSYADAENDPQGASTFRWLRNGIAIAGATGSTYTLVNADYGTTIAFEVTPVATVAPTIGTPVASSATAPVTLPAGYVSQGGLIWTPDNLLNPPNGFDTWPNADAYCSGTTFLGQTGWRLPTTLELHALTLSHAAEGQGWVLNASAAWSSVSRALGKHDIVRLDAPGAAEISASDSIWANVTCVR